MEDELDSVDKFKRYGHHFDMLHDVERNLKYRQAIERALRRRPYMERCIDIGTGSGLLAMLAAKAGCRHVTAIEAVSNLADAAEENIRANGLQSRVALVRKHSTEVVVGPQGHLRLPVPAPGSDSNANGCCCWLQEICRSARS
jgi:predicted RNA methylase